MSAEAILGVIGAVIVIVTIIVGITRKLPKRLKASHYVRKWREIQRLCANPDDWAHAIVHADMLLEDVLRKRKITGKTMGERMVQAQDKFSDNDSLWSAHKLANHIRQEGVLALKDTDVKEALIAFRQGLRDLGAL